MIKNGSHHKVFYGTTTIGEKGQAVIPAEAREELHLKKGEKLLVFGMGKNMLVFSRLENLQKFADSLAGRLKTLQSIINQTRSH